MKTLMLGWEFPPFISGGLGTACYGLTKAMSQLGMEITFVLPIADKSDYASHVKMLSAEGHLQSGERSKLKNVCFRTIISGLRPYIPSEKFELFGKKRESNSENFWQSNSSAS